MANVLDVVLETKKTLNPAPSRKIDEASKAQLEAETKQAEVEATIIETETEAGPSKPAEIEAAEIK
jgi:flagellar biosynthesis GTPase FlhF